MGGGQVLAGPHSESLLRSRHCQSRRAGALGQSSREPANGGLLPWRVSNALESTGFEYLDPMDAFANAQLEASNEAQRHGTPLAGSPLFNGRIGDGHFSAIGSELWAETVGARLALMIEARLNAVKTPKREQRESAELKRRIRLSNKRFVEMILREVEAIDGSDSSPSFVDWTCWRQ